MRTPMGRGLSIALVFLSAMVGIHTTAWTQNCLLNIDKTYRVQPPAPLCPGDTLSYTVCLENVDTRNINVENFLDVIAGSCFETMTFQWSPSDPGTDCSQQPNPPQNGQVCFDLQRMAPGDQYCVDIDATLISDPAVLVPGTDCLNQANALVSCGLPPVQQDLSSLTLSDTVANCAAAVPDFSNATKSHDVPPGETRGPGDTITYTFNICNDATDPLAVATRWSFSDTFSATCFDLAQVVPATDIIVDDSAFAAGTVTTNWNPLSGLLTVTLDINEPFEPGDCMPITVSLPVGPTPDPTCCNDATLVYAEASGPITIPEVCFDTLLQADLTVLKELTEIDGQPAVIGNPGDALHYTIYIMNFGTGEAQRVTFTEPWPACIDASKLTVGDINVLNSSTIPNIVIDPTTFQLDIDNITVAPQGLAVEIHINPTSSTNLIVAGNAPAGDCCNQGSGQYAVIPDNPNSPIARYATTSDPSVQPESPTCFQVQIITIPEAALSASKDIPVIGATNDPLPPRNANGGDAFEYRIELSEIAGDEDATAVEVSETLDGNCIDLSGFDPNADILVTNTAYALDLTGYPTTVLINGMTVPAGQSVIIDFTNLALIDPSPGGDCCNQANVSYLRIPGDPRTVENLLTDDPDLDVDPADRTCMTLGGAVMNLRREGVNNAECPLTLRPASPDVATIFADDITLVATITLPWEEVDFKLDITDVNSPPGNSCLLFYRVENSLAARIGMTTGSAAGNLLIDSF